MVLTCQYLKIIITVSFLEKLTFKFPFLLPMFVWDCSEANIKNIHKAVLFFDWKNAFGNLSVDENVGLFNEILLIIFS